MDRENQILRNINNKFGDYGGNEYVVEQVALSAMREFARERSIGFAEWANQNYGYVELNKWDGIEDETWTTDQLYNLYLEFLNNKQ